MSIQTKEQSIGYILKALIDAGSKSKEMKEAYRMLDESIHEGEELDNYDTMKLISWIVDSMDLEFAEERKLRSDLSWAFDNYTVEEARGFYDSFRKILRIFN